MLQYNPNKIMSVFINIYINNVVITAVSDVWMSHFLGVSVNTHINPADFNGFSGTSNN